MIPQSNTHRCALTSVETAEVYIGVCPVDINTGCKNNKVERVIVHGMQKGTREVSSFRSHTIYEPQMAVIA